MYMDSNALPRFNPARSVLFTLRDRVDKELKRLKEEGTSNPVNISKWAAPIVAVLKKARKTMFK